MGKQLKAVKAPVYVLLGDKDIIFPHAKSQANAEKHISSFVEAKVFENVGHGIECHGPALQWVKEKIAGIEAR
ncbi:MAG: alpha/beta hydrolase [Bacteroidota bacterium]